MFKPFRFTKAVLGTLSLACWLASAQAQTLSQVPLLTQSGSVPPNVLLMFDDSGSMPAEFLYQYGGGQGGYGRTGPDNQVFKATCGSTLDISTTCTYNTPAFNQYVKLSPDVNGITYDPRIRFRPRVDSTGALAAAGTPSNTDFYVYFYKNASGNNVTWPGSDNDPTLFSSYFNPSYTPPASVLATGATTGLIYPNAVSNSTGNLPKWTNRSDCAGTFCTLAEERQNYANFVKYHSNRLDLVKTGLGYAFKDLKDTLRVGWATINDLEDVQSSSGSLASNGGVAQFNDTRRSAFYTWLYSRTAPGNTPNRKALKSAGEYFKRQDNWGPWADYPNATSGTQSSPAVSGSFTAYVTLDPNTGLDTLTKTVTDTTNDRTSHKACRRSYALLVTDGYYNESTSEVGVGEVDSTAISTINGATPEGTAITFSYNGSTRPYPGGGTDTMADVAMKYWITDLRPDLPNRVKRIANPPNSNNYTNESFWQNMGFYAVALGIYGTLPQTTTTLANLTSGATSWPTAQVDNETTIDDMWHATINARGKMLSARNSDALSDGVESMLAEINKQSASQSGVAASTLSLTTLTSKYTPSYTTGSWTGNVVATDLDANGAEQCIRWKVVDTASVAGNASANPYIPPTCSSQPATATAVTLTTTSGTESGYSYAGINPANYATRHVYSWNGSGYGNFDSSNSYVNSNVVGANANLINFLRGDQSNEDTATVNQLYRTRVFVLGDIVNSTPTFIQNTLDMKYSKGFGGTYTTVSGSYASWLSTKANRTEGVLFAGANDGMLHGFRDTTGAEVFAFVPRAVMPKMHLLASRSYNHQYYVDGPTVEADACLTGGASCTTWSNLLLGTAGAGAKTVFALDVTNPLTMTAASVKWEITPTQSSTPSGITTNASNTLQNLGYILSDVQTGLAMNGQWVAVFGNGYYGADGKAYLYVVNLDTGAHIRTIATNSTVGNGLGAVRVVFKDNDTDRRIVGVYAGDLKGNMWKFDLSDTNSANWTVGINGSPLFTTTVPKPITAAPTVVTHPNNDGSRIVAFGTGKLFDSEDISATDTQSVYGIWDKVAWGSPTLGTTVSGTSTLVLQTISNAITGTNIVTAANGTTSTKTVNYYTVSSNAVNWATKNGWYMDLTNAGQRVIYALETLVGRYAAVDTVSPSNVSTDPCTVSGSGRAWNYVIDVTTGSGTTEAIFDTNGDGVINTSDSLAVGYENTADGRTKYIKNVGKSNANVDTGYGSSGAGDNGATYFTPLSTEQLPGFSLKSINSCIVNCNSNTANPIVRRTWRQIFMR